VNTSRVGAPDEIWIPLVDEPIGAIVEQLQAEHPEIAELVSGPRRTLAFRTFAYIRVGLLLGQLLVDHDVPDYDGSETWIEALLHDERHRAAVANELRAVAEELAADPRYVEDAAPGADDARERFRAFAREHLR
jgi:hypothetical protein